MKIIALLITTFFAVCAEAAEVVTSASANMVLLDTTVATNDVVIAGSQSELPITYSASQWNEMDQVGQTVLVTADDDTLLETEEEGIYWRRPMRAGIYGLRHIANGVTLIKSVRFQAPEVQIERFGGNLCKLTASDGVSPIRYTLDGSDPTLGSALYGGHLRFRSAGWRLFGRAHLEEDVCQERRRWHRLIRMGRWSALRRT